MKGLIPLLHPPLGLGNPFHRLAKLRLLASQLLDILCNPSLMLGNNLLSIADAALELKKLFPEVSHKHSLGVAVDSTLGQTSEA